MELLQIHKIFKVPKGTYKTYVRVAMRSRVEAFMARLNFPLHTRQHVLRSAVLYFCTLPKKDKQAWYIKTFTEVI